MTSEKRTDKTADKSSEQTANNTEIIANQQANAAPDTGTAKAMEALAETAKTAQATSPYSDTSAADLEKMKESLQAAIADAARAKTQADTASSSAETAKKNSDAAIEATSAARTNADAASKAATDAQVHADAIAKQVASAQTSATEAAQSATQAKSSFEAASNSASSVAGKVEELNKLASGIETNARIAEDGAKKATGSAQGAKTSAGEAHSSAEASSKSATNAAQNATATQSNLEQANDLLKQVNEASVAVDDFASRVAKALSDAEAHAKRAKVEADNAAQAHNLSTTVGLAGAFNEKAYAAAKIQRIWVVGFLVALAAMVVIGWSRFDTVVGLVNDLLNKDGSTVDKVFALIVVQGTLSVLSLAGPLLLVWMSARMISKYFHLSEDYSYKAAVAQAYIGFKEQSQGLDPVFQERLFAAAVTQLDANPVRFMDPSCAHPGSPVQDLLQQPFMQAAMTDPTFKGLLVSWFQKIFKTNFPLPTIKVTAEASPPPPEATHVS